MDALAGYGSDDSSSAGSVGSPKPTSQSALEQLIASHSSDASDQDDQVKEHLPATKKSRVDESNISSLQLLEPALAKGGDDDNDSWILWKTNYLLSPSHKITNELPLQPLDPPPPSRVQIRDNLQRLARNIETNIPSWAEHLRNQQEFHNPHFFASVVEHFGIATPLASFLGDAQVPEYERKLFPLGTTEGNL